MRLSASSPAEEKSREKSKIQPIASPGEAFFYKYISWKRKTPVTCTRDEVIFAFARRNIAKYAAKRSTLTIFSYICV